VVYVTSGNYINSKGALYALAAATGTQLWQHDIGYVFPPSSPSVANGLVYASSINNANGSVLALDAATGTLLWQTSPQETGNYSPIVVNGVLYYGNNYFGIRSFHLPQ
jgi:outer membrane protein assembly factor BamB